MDERFDLQKYLTEGVEQVALKATLKDPRESAFLVKFAAACAVADKRREKNEKDGLHVPSYLIASITSSCNLHCEGCYSRANNATIDCEPMMQLSGDEWQRIFREAERRAYAPLGRDRSSGGHEEHHVPGIHERDFHDRQAPGPS